MLNYESVGIIDAVQVIRTNSSFSSLETMREAEEKAKVLNEHGIGMNLCIELKNVASRYIAGCDLAVSELNGNALKNFSKPCRRQNKCCSASTAISSRFIDFRKILQ